MIESITDCAFSCPISSSIPLAFVGFYGRRAYVGNSRRRFEGGYDHYYGLSERSWNRVSGRHRSNHLEMISMSSDSRAGTSRELGALVVYARNLQKTVPKS